MYQSPIACVKNTYKLTLYMLLFAAMFALVGLAVISMFTIA